MTDEAQLGLKKWVHCIWATRQRKNVKFPLYIYMKFMELEVGDRVMFGDTKHVFA